MKIKKIKCKNKKGEVTLAQMVPIIIAIASFAVLLFLWYRLNYGGGGSLQTCHSSVVLTALTKNLLGKPNCRTQYVCISGGDKCSDINPTETIKIDSITKDEVLKAIADKTVECWSTFGEGNLDYVARDRLAVYNSACAICHVVKFDDKIINKFSGENCMTSESSITLARYNQYVNYKAIFDKYIPASDSAMAQIITPNQFRALLAAIAQENNWGSNGDWIMGYPFTDQTYKNNYKTADIQISTISLIIKSALIGAPNMPSYPACKYDGNLRASLKCTLSVLKTGKTTISSEGNKYADEVLTLWDWWSDFFNSGAKVPSNLGSNCITYFDFFNYLANNKMPGSEQTYLTYLYPFSNNDLNTVFTTFSQMKDDNANKNILLGDEYVTLTGEVKIDFIASYILNNKEGFIGPYFIDSNDIPKLNCGEFLTKVA